MLCDFSDLDTREILLINQKVDACCRCIRSAFFDTLWIVFFSKFFRGIIGDEGGSIQG